MRPWGPPLPSRPSASPLDLEEQVGLQARSLSWYLMDGMLVVALLAALVLKGRQARLDKVKRLVQLKRSALGRSYLALRDSKSNGKPVRPSEPVRFSSGGRRPHAEAALLQDHVQDADSPGSPSARRRAAALHAPVEQFSDSSDDGTAVLNSCL